MLVGYGEKNKWNLSATARYNGTYYTDIDNTKGIGQSGRWGQVDDHWIFNSRANYIWGQSTLYISGTNIFDTKHISSISAEGLKVGNGRTIMSGIEFNFYVFYLN